MNLEEAITRKEYLKRKKKQKKSLKKKSKISYIIITVFSLLAIYVLFEFYVYSKANNFKYVEGMGVSDQIVYNMYYVTEGYTYNPVYSLNSARTDGFNDKLIYQNSGMHDIVSKDSYIYGLKNGALCRYYKTESEIEDLVDSGVQKYTIANNKIYYIANNKLNYINLESKEKKELNVDGVSEVIVDENNVFVAKSNKSKKILVKYNLEGEDEKVLTDSANISYIIQNNDNIFFVNKSDANKIYKITKNGENMEAISEVKGVADNGILKEIDGSKTMFVSENMLYYINPEDNGALYSINLETKENEKVIHSPVQILQNVDDSIFYKVKNEMGVYLYNYNTQFMSKITNRNVSEFSVDGLADKAEKIQTNKLSKN